MPAAEKYHFQYCQKLVLFDDEERVLLARRKGEADYDETFSFPGGKMEVTDQGFKNGLIREKQEELGRQALLLVALQPSYNIYYEKRDGSAMVLSHLYGQYVSGKIELNEEYSEYRWVAPEELDSFEPKIDTIPAAVEWGRRIRKLITIEDLTAIQ